MEDLIAVIFHQLEDNILVKEYVKRLQLALQRNLTFLAEVINFLSIDLLPCYLNAGVQSTS